MCGGLCNNSLGLRGRGENKKNLHERVMQVFAII